jgi:hypothetical protein
MEFLPISLRYRASERSRMSRGWLLPVPPPATFTYTVNRALAGTTAWTLLTPAPITALKFQDVVPDPTKTYTYQVRAIAADGTFGTASFDYTPPARGGSHRLYRDASGRRAKSSSTGRRSQEYRSTSSPVPAPARRDSGSPVPST